MVPDRPETVVPVPAPAVAMPADPPASKAATARPVQKPLVVARADAADAPPPVVHKPAAGVSSAASAAAGDGGEARSLRSVKTVAAATARFASLGYDLDAVRSAAHPVPRIYLESLPRDLARIRHVAAKKTLFVQVVLPVVLRVNEELVAARWRAEHLGNRLARRGTLSSADRKWLLDAAELYGTKPLDVPALLSRMDIVPPSLAIAQAAEESGWGTSRFVLEGNALFGQYTYKSKTGMVPMRRDADRQHRVRRYEDLLDAARSYVLQPQHPSGVRGLPSPPERHAPCRQSDRRLRAGREAVEVFGAPGGLHRDHPPDHPPEPARRLRQGMAGRPPVDGADRLAPPAPHLIRRFL